MLCRHSNSRITLVNFPFPKIPQRLQPHCPGCTLLKFSFTGQDARASFNTASYHLSRKLGWLFGWAQPLKLCLCSVLVTPDWRGPLNSVCTFGPSQQAVCSSLFWLPDFGFCSLGSDYLWGLFSESYQLYAQQIPRNWTWILFYRKGKVFASSPSYLYIYTF